MSYFTDTPLCPVCGAPLFDVAHLDVLEAEHGYSYRVSCHAADKLHNKGVWYYLPLTKTNVGWVLAHLGTKHWCDTRQVLTAIESWLKAVYIGSAKPARFMKQENTAHVA